MLTRQYGFPEQNVTLLLDGQATNAAILQALNELADRRRVGDEDRILVFFSGHGQTVTLATGATPAS